MVQSPKATPDEAPPRFVSWAAVSSEEQADKISLDDQEQTNIAHIERRGGKLVASLVVPGKSRDIVLFEDACSRIEAYAQLRDLISARAFDVLICLNRSRLGRTLALVETIAELCRRAGVLIYETESPPARLDAPLGTYDEMLLGAIKSAGAQREIAEISRRHEMGMRGKFKRGEFLEGVPWGWREVYDADGNSRIEIDPDAAVIIRLVLVDLYVTRGWGMEKIADELNRRGVTTPEQGKPYNRFRARAFLRMVWRYGGYNEINRQSKKRPYARARGAWPAILSEEELHAILAERDARRTGRRAVNARYRLSLVCWCVRCNKRMRMGWYRKTYPLKDGETGVFEQARVRCSHEKQHFMVVPEHRILAELRAEFVRLRDNDAWHTLLDRDVPDGSDIEAQIAAHLDAIARHKQAMRRADDLFIDGTLDGERHSHQVKRLQARIEQAQHDITVLEDRRAALDHAAHRGDRIAEVAASGLRMLEHPDISASNAWLRRHVRVWVEDGQVAEIEFL